MQACKAFKKLLSDQTSYYWKKRIELTFPTTYKEILREDMRAQTTKLRPFDALIHEGYQVSCLDLEVLASEKLFSVSLANNLDIHQLPWKPHLFIIQFENTMCLLDCLAGRLLSKISADFEEDLHSVGVILDNKSNAKYINI